jgi:hypothetical protein
MEIASIKKTQNQQIFIILAPAQIAQPCEIESVKVYRQVERLNSRKVYKIRNKYK